MERNKRLERAVVLKQFYLTCLRDGIERERQRRLEKAKVLGSAWTLVKRRVARYKVSRARKAVQRSIRVLNRAIYVETMDDVDDDVFEDNPVIDAIGFYSTNGLDYAPTYIKDLITTLDNRTIENNVDGPYL